MKNLFMATAAITLMMTTTVLTSCTSDNEDNPSTSNQEAIMVNTAALYDELGIRSEMAAGDVSGTVRLTLKEGMYAVFQTQPSGQHDFVETVQRTWDWIYDVWMPENGFRRGRGYECERYTESSRTFREEILVPIVPERSGQNEPADAGGGY